MASYVVTGASRGIGLAFVKRLSEVPENIVFALIRSRSTIIDTSVYERPNVHILEADVADSEKLKSSATKVAALTGGTLDVLINNAVYTSPVSLAKLNLDSLPDEATLAEELHKNIDVNVLGVIYTTNTFLPLLRAGKTKKVICVTSVLSDAELAAKHEITADPIYSISKAAMNMAVAKYAAQFKKAGFVFLAISPGVVQTDSLESKQVAEPEFAHQMFVEIQAIYKNFHAAQTPEESVKAMLNVVNNVTVDISGTVISYKGDKEWV